MKLARDFEACRRRLVIPASLAIALMAAGIGSAPAVASSGWSIQPTPNLSGPPQGGLDSVSCTAASACAAVGDYVNPSGTGVPLAERWNGTEWTVQSVPNPGGSGVLSGVSCGGANSCTAVGNYVSSLGTVVTLAEHWNGTSWAIQTTPDPAGASRSVLSGVSCTADGACTAVGYYVNSSGTGQTLAEHWDASGWKIETTATPSGGGDLARVSCSAATACTALGQASGTTLVYRWDGSKWSSQMIAIPAGATSTELNGVSCMGASACTGVGNWHEVRCNNGQPSCNCFKSPGCTFRAGTLVEQWNGSAWSVQSTLNPDGNERYVDLYDVSCTATGCTAVGDVLNGTLAEQSDGTNWTVEGTPGLSGAGSLSSVSCTAAAACVAVGTGNGATLAEGWNGTSWAIQATTNPPGPANRSLSGVSCPTSTACTAVGSYTNTSGKQVTLAEAWNGTSWARQSTPTQTGATAGSLSGVSCATATACTATGDYEIPPGGNPPSELALAERWNGTSWTIQPTSSVGAGYDSVLTGVSCSSASACTAVGDDYYNQGPQDALLAEQWNSTAWALQPAPIPSGTSSSAFSAVSCPTETACMTVGVSSLSDPLAERWNGAAWTIEPTPGGGSLNGVSCPAANACTAVGGLGTPVAEQWNGNAWTPNPVPLPAGNNGGQLSSVSCTTATDCIAVGYYNLMIGPDDDPDLTLVEHWDGSAWTIEPSPNPPAVGAYLTGVSCTTATACTAVGHYQNGLNMDVTLVERYTG